MTNNPMSKEEHVAYTKEWRRLRCGHGWSSDLSGYVIVTLDNAPVYSEPKSVNEETLEIEEIICSFFGCKKQLSLLETLCGNRCVNHQGGSEDITNAISI